MSETGRSSSPAVFLCVPHGRACWCCDSRKPEPDTGWITVAEHRTYCSPECRDEWEEYLATLDANLRCCPSCGFDRQEHADDWVTTPTREDR